MDPHALLIWGLTVWLALSSQECNAAAYKGRFYSHDGVSSDPLLQPPASERQETSPGTMEPGQNQQIKVFLNTGDSATPVTNDHITRERPFINAAENPPKSADVAVIQKERPTNDAKTDSKPDSQSSMPEFIEEGTEEEDENGIIRGKYSYVEEDGVPAQIEYEAVPGVKFEVKTYIKGLKVLPLPDIIESPEIERALAAGNSNLNPTENKNYSKKDSSLDFPKPNVETSKTSSTILMERNPEYEHASVVGRYHLKPLSRKTRTTNEHNHDQNSEPDLAHESEVNVENTENDNTQVDSNSESSIDASYKFGFSADGQTRDEESDAQGNVQGSYSYIGDGGMLTRVEYEAGSGKGFIIKKFVQEDTRKTLDVPKSPGPMNLDESSDQLNSNVEVSPPISSNQEVQSEDHKIQIPHKKSPIVVNIGKNFGEEETESEDKISMNQNNDGSYSISYATPDQWRKESVDSTGHIKSKFSFIIPGDNKIKLTQYENVQKEGFINQDFKLPLIHNLQAPKFVTTPALTNINTNNLKINRDGSYSFSYLTPHQHHSEVAQIKKPDSFLPKDRVTTKQENEESSGGKDLSTSQNIQDNTANVDNTSPIQNDGSYSYSYETADQMKQEEGDIDGNVQGQYSYIADDGIRRTVHYKAGPGSGFTAEGSHLPSTENAGTSNAEEVKASVKSFITPMELETPTPHSITNHENIPPVSGGVDQLNTDSSNKNLHYEGINSNPTEQLSLTPTVSFIPQQGSGDSPQVLLDLSGIRRADATKDNGYVQKYKKTIKKRPIEPTIPTSANAKTDGSYSFAYDNQDQLREESVDTKGNVYSNYQYKTKDGGRTVVVFIRKRVKEEDGPNEDIGIAANIHHKQIERNIPLEYVNEDRRYQHDNHRSFGGRNWFNRKRHVQGLPDPNTNNYSPAQLQDSQVNSNIRTPLGHQNVFQNTLSIPSTNESTETIYRRAKSIIRPFRGNVRYQRQII